MCSTRIRTVLLGVVFAAALCLAKYSSVIGQSSKKSPLPRHTLPEKVYSDPVLLALEGWEEFEYITVKGTEQDALKAAAKRGAEGAELEETQISSGGGKVLVWQSRQKYGSTTVDNYQWGTGKVKFSKGYRVALYRRTEPDAQRAFDMFGSGNSDSYWPRDVKTLKEIMALGPVNLNNRPRGWTVLYSLVYRICEEAGRNKTLVIRPGMSIPRDDVRDIYYNTRTRKIVYELIDVVNFLLEEGADPNIPCGEKLNSLPIDLVTAELQRSIERYGDFSTIIEQFSDWRYLDTPLTAAHLQTVLIELKGLLMKPGKATKGLKSDKAIADESKTSVTPSRRKSYSAPPPMTIDSEKQYTATIKTMKGDIVLDLFAKDAPITVNNFVFLAREGYYDGTTFHLVDPGYLVEGGAKHPYYLDLYTAKHIHPLPGYSIPLELSPSTRKHGTGTIMAEACPGCSGSEFFITYKPYPNLDGNAGYPVFGEVTSGMDILQKLIIGDVVLRITIQEK